MARRTGKSPERLNRWQTEKMAGDGGYRPDGLPALNCPLKSGAVPFNGDSCRAAMENDTRSRSIEPKEKRDPLKLARYYQSLLDSGKFESRAALSHYLSVSRARVTQVLGRLKIARLGEQSY